MLSTETFEDTQPVRTLYGSHVEYRTCVGYCSFHRLFVTARQLKQKQCLGKECGFLIKKEHDFWKFRERRLIKKSLKKQAERNRHEELYALIKQNSQTPPAPKSDAVVWGHDIVETNRVSVFLE